MVERQKGRPVEQQVIPGDMDKWMREEAPPLAILNSLGHEHHRLKAGTGQDRCVKEGEQGDKEQQFGAAQQRDTVRSKWSAAFKLRGRGRFHCEKNFD